MSIESDLTRRTVLTVGAVTVGGVVLAACSSGSSTTTPSPATSDGSSPGDSGSSSTPADAGSSTSSSGSGGSGAAALATLDDIPVGQAVSVTLANGKPAVVARPTSTTAAAFSAICTHQGCTVKPAGAKLDCPCHGSEFNALTGAVLKGPAQQSLPKVAVTVQDGKVVEQS